MFLDASAIVAVLLREAEAPLLLKAMEAARGKLRYSPLVRIDAVERLVRRKAERAGKASGVTEDFAEAAELVSGFLSAVEAREMHITTGMGEEAVRALSVYGATAGHPAQLDLAGALTYACAKAYHIPVLASDDRFKGTDIA